MTSVILKENLRGIGKAGEVVEVKSGYARYLVNQKKVFRATEKNLRFVEQRRQALIEENEKKIRQAQEIKQQLTDKILVVIRQSSDDGKIYGSVTSKDISKLLLEMGHNIKYTNINITNIKYLGEYTVSLELHADLLFSIPLHVVRNEVIASEVKKMHAQKISKKTEEDKIGDESINDTNITERQQNN